KRFETANPNGVTIPINDAAIRAFESLIELCQQSNIKLILVYSPQFHEMIRLTRNRVAIFALFTAIAKKYSVPFIDYTQSPISQSQDFFYNSQHLNERGAAIFSDDLGRR